MLPALPCDLDDRYTLTAELGRGSHAIVYRALDRHLDREVAVKVLREELLGSEVSERFLREIRLTSKLEHPNIAHVYGTGEFLGKPYFVIALAKGATLGERLKREHQLPVPEAIAIAKQVASALQHAHSTGIIHRDVKPDNILLTSDGALLSDFGVARALQMAPGTLATSTGTAVGTLLYMSPEQLCAEPDIDGRSDQYALALVLYEMLAGVSAHTAANAEGLRGLRIIGQHAPVRAHRPTVPEHVEAAIQQALMPSPADRFSSMNEFIAALEGNGVSATHRLGSTTASGRAVASKPASRRVMIGAAVVTVVVTGVLATRYFVRPESAVVLNPTADMAMQFAIVAEGDSAVAGALANEMTLWSPDIRANVGASSGSEVMLQTRVTPVTNGQQVTVQVQRDARTAQRVVQATLPSSGAGRADSLRVLAARTLLATQVDPGTMELPSRITDRSLPSLRRYGDGWVAMLAGDLPAAEQAFADAARTKSIPQAAVWQATVATWLRPRAPGSWRDVAVTAQALSAQLSPRDSLLAEAMRHRADDRLPAACDAYTRATAIEGGSFAAWYGLGECLRFDSLVVASPDSPTGFQFRSSRWSALRAFGEAIERMPSPGMVSLFDILSRVAMASNLVRRNGVTLTGEPVLGFPSMSGDSVAVFPLPSQRMMRGGAGTIPATYQAAVRRSRARLLELTTRLAQRAPQSLSAQLQYAKSLELAGILDGAGNGATALSVIRSAAGLTRTRADSVELGLLEARVLLRLGNFAGLPPVADRLLEGRDETSPTLAKRLIPLAIIVGRPDVTEALFVRANGVSTQAPDGLPPTAARAVARYAVVASNGACDDVNAARTAASDALRSVFSPTEFDRAADRYLSQSEWMEQTCPGVPLPRGESTADPILRAVVAAHAGRREEVQAILRANAESRSAVAGSAIAWDTRFSEIWLAVQSGDTVGARGQLAGAFSALSATMDFVLEEPAQGSGLRRSLELCRDITTESDREVGTPCRAALAALSSRGAAAKP